MNARDLVKIGNTVVIQRYTRNWVSDMEQYVGKAVKITYVYGTDNPEHSGFNIDADCGRWGYGYCMIDVPATLALKSTTGGNTMDFSKLKVGDKVIIKKSDHNWVSAMDQYIGRTLKISRVSALSLSLGRGIKFKDADWNWGTSHIDVEKTIALNAPKLLVKDGFRGMDGEGKMRYFLPSLDGVYSTMGGARDCGLGNYNDQLESGISKQYSVNNLFDTDGNLVWERPNPNAKEIEKLETEIAEYEATQRKYAEKAENALLKIKVLKGGN